MAGLPSHRHKRHLAVPVLLVVLALLDLRVEIQLLFDHVTLTSLLAALLNHPLAIAVLLLVPPWFRHDNAVNARQRGD